MDSIPITGDRIKLGQFLKLANLVEQGADAKLLLAEERVLVNGEVDVRRGRQLVKGDTVSVDDMAFEVG
ncbi:RNA-binding S4 domain-containing protein [Euzebya rosea]|uniref:RNA-binding S4 domain-containing protein n=1 Tax=Euzebya rosea TaxID=2052804 RepID=UPI000D3E89B1|nr:RNA-binding S4 domain-containing protein [Euzebya rosea]